MSTEDDYQDSESHTDMDLIQPRGKDGKTMADRKEQEDEIAGAEIRRALTFSRVLLLTVLALSTVGVAAGVYIYTSRAETEAFENQFEEDALKVLESIGTSLDFTLGAVDSFVINEVSHAKSLNMTWPFVTIPDFAVEASKLRSLTKAVVVSQYPYVLESERYAWENYSVTNEAWVEDGLKTQKEDTNFHGTNVEEWKAWGNIHGNKGYHEGPGPYFPTWQSSPVVPVYSPYNWDLMLHYPQEIEVLLQTKKVVIGKTDNLPPDGSNEDFDEQTVQWIKGFIGQDGDPTEPINVFYYPILADANMQVKNTGNLNDELQGVLVLTGFWREFVKDILPPGSEGIDVVFGNECDQRFTFQILGPDSLYLGGRDMHDPHYDKYMKQSAFTELGQFSISDRKYSGAALNDEFCPYWVKVYPSSRMEDQYKTNDPVVFTVVAVCIFLFTSVVFLGYDFLNTTRQKRIMASALQTNAIVSSLFPNVVRDRVLNPGVVGATESSAFNEGTPKLRLKSYLREDVKKATGQESKSSPIAEFFSDTTVLFADIAGFTAWSSVREPSQVFTLLEALYGSFDEIARKRGAFKVETIGDSYVAVTGLPEPRNDHAVAMARFAKDCREKAILLCKELEVTLGPGTADLQLRFGLNSGPVTAGVLRGERARFQLFGDTVNTAARMESNGIRNKIHISQSTADLLVAAGKGHWVTMRDELVEAKGKGMMQTYWCKPHARASIVLTSSSKSSETQQVMDEGLKRLVNWNIDIISRCLVRIIARREAAVEIRKIPSGKSNIKVEPSGSAMEEVKEIIELPEFDAKVAKHTQNPESIQLDTVVKKQLETYVTAIASMYRKNAFHNFEHASHVAMSVTKLLTRIVAPDEVYEEHDEGNWHLPSRLHDHTYGITSDPLTQFACIFCALIHDVDHPGVPNTVLVSEASPMAKAYNNKSIAEQNSIDIAWTLLNEDTFSALRGAICANDSEMARFRQLVVNTVMATDVLDKDLKLLRNERWERAFAETAESSASRDAVNRKATIVIEHLIQASDVAHTMQHWHIYRKWNERLFEELYVAYKAGRGEKSPAEFWYEGELGFFDFYIIPLARKLRDCGVFGVSSDEYLGYAERNREEWERRGRQVVESMVESLRLKYPEESS